MNSTSFQSTSRESTGQLPTTSAEVGTLTLDGQQKDSNRKATRLEKLLLRQLLEAIGSPPVIAVLWSGEEVRPSAGAATDLTVNPIRFHLSDRATLWRILVDPFFQFPDAYCNGRMQVDGDLEALMGMVAESSTRAPKASMWFTYLAKLLHWGGRNTLAGSQKHVHHHYDIGNDFYRLWLDENLLYTCAYFEEPTASLEQAQLSKMDHVCRKLELKPGENVIEAGCGWGGFAIHMAKQYGVRVKAYNISREQVAEARRRAQDEGLSDRVEFVLEDWRKISGKCDVFVSIGMLEHVGTANYKHLGDVIDRCLCANGRGLIHTIGRNRRQPLDAWIERRIFPGAYPPALGQMSPIFEPHDLSVLDVENIRLHYAETLRHWLMRYEQSIETIRGMYDERFVRMWRTYLAGSIAAFQFGSLQLFQVLFARPTRNQLPLTRAHEYAHCFETTAGNGQPKPFETVYWGQR